MNAGQTPGLVASVNLFFTSRFWIILILLFISTNPAALFAQSPPPQPLGFEQRVDLNGEAEYVFRSPHNELVLKQTAVLLNIRQSPQMSASLTLVMDNIDRGAKLIPERQPVSKVNYLLGSDTSKWKRDIPIYEAVRYSRLYPDIDVVFHSDQQGIEYDYFIAPRADPTNIKMSIKGAHLFLDKNGDLLTHTNGRSVRFKRPLAYQQIAGSHIVVGCHYVLLSRHRIGFALGQYNHQYPLVIDPIISYATYIGGTGAENAQSIAVDQFGSAYVTGTAVLPTDLIGTPNAFQQTATEVDVIFVAKLDPSGSRFEYLTYLGGTDPAKTSDGRGIAVDNTGSAYICGVTSDSSYPTTPGAFQTSLSQVSAVISKFTPAGDNLIFSTFLGSSVSTTREASGATAIQLDSSKAIYVTGFVTAPNFPVTAGSAQPHFGGIEDAFVAKVSPDGSRLLYSTYLGGSDQDQACCIAVDGAGNAYIAGQARSLDFPTTPGAFKATQNAFVSGDTFVTKVSPDGKTFIYSTLLGSGEEFSDDLPLGIAVDHSGDAVVVGIASDLSFPVTPSAYQTIFPARATPGFVTKISSDGSHLVFSTFLAGPGTVTIPALNAPVAVAVDAHENIVVVGETDSKQFPVTGGGLSSVSAEGPHAFVSILNSTGSSLPFSSYISGSGFELTSGVALDKLGNIFLSGLTTSTDFPVTPGAAQTKYGGGSRDAFVAKVIPPICADSGGDTDGDGLCDDWERFGLTVNVNGIPVFLDLPSMGADPNHKDIFVQADYMVQPGICLPVIGCFAGHSHKPKLDAISLVTQAFANAPVGNPDGTTGIRLHVDCGASCVMNPVTGALWGSQSRSHALPHTTDIGATPSGGIYDWTDFQTIKLANFPLERAPVFHYVVWAHNLGGLGSTSGRSRDIPSSDFIVSLGSWTDSIGTVLEQAGTFMHELGHNLSLRHGGGDDLNYKPNYLSVMNYIFQTNGLIIDDVSGNLDYSRVLLPMLDENNLNENTGLSGGPSLTRYGTAFYCLNHLTNEVISIANAPIDWNCNGNIGETNISAEINSGVQSGIYQNDHMLEKLNGFNDWASVIFNGGGIGSLAGSSNSLSMTNQQEITQEIDAHLTKLLSVRVTGARTARSLAGASFVVTLTVANNGVLRDTYTLLPTTDVTWADLSGIPPSLELQPGSSVQIHIPIIIPASATVGTAGNLLLLARSQTNPAVRDVASLEVVIATGPHVAVSVSPSILWPPNGKMVSVTVTGTIAGTEFGVDATTASFEVAETEGLIQSSGIITLMADGTYSFNVKLEASRHGNDHDGRQYAIKVSARDNIGLPGSDVAVVTVPHDRRK